MKQSFTAIIRFSIRDCFSRKAGIAMINSVIPERFYRESEFRLLDSQVNRGITNYEILAES